MRSLKLFYVIGISLLIIYLIAEYNRPPEVDWSPSLSYNDKIPFGTYILYHEIHRLFGDASIMGTNKTFYDQFHDTAVTKSNYIIIANSISMSKYDFSEMVKYMRNGNSVFIATTGFMQMGLKPNILADTLKLELNSYFGKNIGNVNFTNTRLRLKDGYKFDRSVASGYFSSFDTARAVVLSKNSEGYANLLRYNFGNGSLYLCADPEIFSNYSLLNGPGADYAAKALSYMPVRQVVYWDHLQNNDIPEDESPVRVFFRYPALRWAYYIALFTLLGFVFYEMKRRQRIIPIIEPLKNSSLDFVNVVGQVYYEQHNNQNIAQKKITYFLEYLRSKYYLKTTPLDQEFIERLALKTGIERSQSEEIVNHINYLNNRDRVTDRDLILLNQLIQQFYNQSS